MKMMIMILRGRWSEGADRVCRLCFPIRSVRTLLKLLPGPHTPPQAPESNVAPPVPSQPAQEETHKDVHELANLTALKVLASQTQVPTQMLTAI